MAALVMWLVAAVAAPEALADPQDGPHADLRITVTDKDVRFVVGMNLPFVDAAAPFVREAPDDLDPAEERAAWAALFGFIRDRSPVEIDGRRVEPVFERTSIERLDEDLVGLFPETGRAALTRFSMVIVYPAEQPPEKVRFTWGAFPPSSLGAALDRTAEGDGLPLMTINGLLTAGGRVTRFLLSSQEPTHEWQRDGLTMQQVMAPVPELSPGLTVTFPIVSGLAGFVGILTAIVFSTRERRWLTALILGLTLTAAFFSRDLAPVTIREEPVDSQQAAEVFAVLHENIYRAFDYSSEDDIFDALAMSVGGDLLHALYTQIRTGLIQAEHDGAMGRVTDLELLSTGLASRADDRYTIDAEWEVEGTVYHFGHSHAKRRRFSATFEVHSGDDGWRIAAATPRSAIDLRPSEL
ncbi:MAG: hypothetical protein AAGF47_04260 [Planctomycetota bacterium]